jgi:hypothetical protein
MARVSTALQVGGQPSRSHLPERAAPLGSGTVADRVDPARIVDDWVGVVIVTMHPSALGAWTAGGVPSAPTSAP